METHLSKENILKEQNDIHEPQDFEKRRSEINKLRKLYKKQDCGIKLYHDSDEFLLRFLRARKFDQNEALTLLNNYHKYFENWPEMSQKVKNPQSVKESFEFGCAVAINGRAVDGSAVCVLRPGIQQNGIFENYMAALIITVETLLIKEINQIYGISFILDKNFVTFQMAIQLKPDLFKKGLDLYQRVLPIRFRSLSFVNDSKFFQSIFAMGNFFMSLSFKNKLKFHGTDFNSLHKVIEASVLPPEYGGTGPHMDVLANQWTNEVFLNS